MGGAFGVITIKGTKEAVQAIREKVGKITNECLLAS